MRLIDADDLVKRIWYGNTDPVILRGYASGLVDAAPTIEAEPVKHGRWIMRGGWLRCSECDEKTLCKRIGGTGGFSYELEQVRSKRCPNCGAKMDEEGSNV